MSDIRTIYVGKKPVHVYVAAVLHAMQAGDREVELVARGNAIRTAIDAAEICRRRNGHIAGLLPEEMNNKGVEIGTETVEMDDHSRILSFIRIQLEGVGDFPSEEE
jgi:DNA-binding protein Alba